MFFTLKSRGRGGGVIRLGRGKGIHLSTLKYIKNNIYWCLIRDHGVREKASFSPSS